MKKAVILAALALIFSACPAQKDDTTPEKSKPKDIQANRITGSFLDGSDFDSVNYRGERIVLGFFSYKHKDALSMIRALQRLKPYESRFNFRIILVSIDYNDPDGVKDFLKKTNIDLPVVLEGPGLKIAGKFGIEHEVTTLGLNADHVPAFGFKRYVFADMPDGEAVFLDYIKENLSIKEYHETIPRVGIYPEAPDFTAKALDGSTVQLSQYRGQVVQLIFFSPKCPVCQHEMEFLRDQLYPKLHDKGYEVLAVSVLPLEGRTLQLYESFKFKWPVIDDSKRRIRKLYSPSRSVPENYFIDKEGRIREHFPGYSKRSDAIDTMLVKNLLGLDNPPLLSDKEYNGVESCKICHEPQYVTWSVTPHAHAWETLEIKGEDTNPECVGCHSVGFKDAKGYYPVKLKATGKEVAYVPPWFREVQCENCHGIGGPHMTPVAMLTRERLEKTCLECHTKKFSLHFDFDERIKKVNHSNKDAVMKMGREERLALLKRVAKKAGDLFDTSIRYVGSQNCATCHEELYNRWKNADHGQAFAALKKAGKQDDPNCLRCHTVGYGEASGYISHVGDESFENVGCESCHGPGAKHVESKKKSDIRGLGDDCPFCVVEQICLSCHDRENAPGFNIYRGLEKLREAHGYE